MYRVCVQKSFEANHYLIGGDWGAENQLHSHQYTLELEMWGRELDQHQYLIDIVQVNSILDSQIGITRGQILNALPDFDDVNPSLEFFARWFCLELSEKINAANVQRIVVRLWENESAWAGYELER